MLHVASEDHHKFCEDLLIIIIIIEDPHISKNLLTLDM